MVRNAIQLRKAPFQAEFQRLYCTEEQFEAATWSKHSVPIHVFYLQTISMAKSKAASSITINSPAAAIGQPSWPERLCR